MLFLIVLLFIILQVQIQSFISKENDENVGNKNGERKKVNFQKGTNSLLQEANRLSSLINECKKSNLSILTQEKVARLVLRSARGKIEHLIKIIMALSKNDVSKKRDGIMTNLSSV